jgi:hypothetical protein
MAKAVIIKIDGTKSIVEFTNETCYKVLSKAVGGYVESIQLKDETTLWVNETGKLDLLKQNSIATAIFANNYGLLDYVVGDAIFTGGTDNEGEIIGLTDEEVLALLDFNDRIILE